MSMSHCEICGRSFNFLNPGVHVCPKSVLKTIDEEDEAEELVFVSPVEKGEMKMDEPIMQFFAYAHLPEKLQAISKPFGELAQHVVTSLPRNPERTVALRKLLEAKDAAVRANLFK